MTPIWPSQQIQRTCAHCLEPVTEEGLVRAPGGTTFHEDCYHSAHEEMFMTLQDQDEEEDDMTSVLDKEQAVEKEIKGEPEGAKYRRAYDEASSKVKKLENRLKERILEDPELRGIYKKLQQAEEGKEEANEVWREEVYTPAKNRVKQAKRRREDRFEQMLDKVIAYLEDRGEVELAESLEGARTRRSVNGKEVEQRGLTFSVSTWDGMRLNLETEIEE